MSFDLRDYYMDGDTIVDISGTNPSESTVCADTGLITGIACNVSNSATTVATTFDISKNGVDTGVDALLPIMAVNTGTVMEFDGAPIDVEVGDRFNIRSNGETGNTPNLVIAWITRR